jgi:hypothetical protein
VDILHILSKRRRVFEAPISIKPDMPPGERQKKSVLLNKLVSPGNVFKIRGFHLYVHNKLNGHCSTSILTEI